MIDPFSRSEEMDNSFLGCMLRGGGILWKSQPLASASGASWFAKTRFSCVPYHSEGSKWLMQGQPRGCSIWGAEPMSLEFRFLGLWATAVLWQPFLVGFGLG